MGGGREGGYPSHHSHQQQQQQQQQQLQRQPSSGMSMSHSSSGYIGRTHSTGHIQLPALVLEEGGAGGAPGIGGGQGGGGGHRSLHSNSKVGGTDDYTMGHEFYHPPSPCGNNPALPPSPLRQQQQQGQQEQQQGFGPNASGTSRHGASLSGGGGREGGGGPRMLSKRSMTMAAVASSLMREGGGGGEGRPPKPPGKVVRKVGGGGGEEEGRRKVGDEYDVDQSVILGEGSYAAVYGAVHRETGERVAVKAIKRRYLFSEDEKASVRNEIDNMRRIPKHRNVIRLRETFESVEHVYLVMERSTHGNLDQMLQLRRKLTELETMWVVKQLLDAVDLLHRAGVLHCDLKPHNLLFSDLDDGIALAMTKGKNEKESQPRRMWMYTSPLGMILKVRFVLCVSLPPSLPPSLLPSFCVCLALCSVVFGFGRWDCLGHEGVEGEGEPATEDVDVYPAVGDDSQDAFCVV